MKIRVKFAKYGAMKYLGHLDVLRYFQKALRRADIDILYTKGFSPHPMMTFAIPLGVGQSSIGEYLDLEVNSVDSTSVMCRRLNEVMVDGMEILDCVLLPDDAKNAMRIVAAAEYDLRFRENYIPDDLEQFERDFEDYMSRREILVEKDSKKGTRTLDIRPLIYHYSINRSGEIRLCIATGSVAHLKPDFIMQCFYRAYGMEWNAFAVDIERVDLFAINEKDGKMISLSEMGDEITIPIGVGDYGKKDSCS